eukprot:CAMPEP_0113316252 /NCGR_PEP_ID=MMETSP0010_2-20120614/11597_1 /TAXON_ID=216773 ORGANISM="Corethron hystrix, Strain 308" /NCGR_SAMPLE_ID=MMETSP0010_2 /ASSEMBLY_ACC=CAM_ASM_000155 /LENGTH=273 /DNA_ID=CAMNT_0000172921 /DNA_START=301 /DNA_END=1122 /DNA_ORIENTATION=+ /assembly_acc=CAM_ASM_000155
MSVLLTNKPGFIQIHFNKYQECDYSTVIRNYDVLERATIEVKLDNGVIRTKPETFLTTVATRRVGIDKLPKIEQSDLKVNFQRNSKRISVTFPPLKGTYSYRLRGSIAPNDDVIASFYSKEKKRFFFIYLKKNGKTGVASCIPTRGPHRCHYTNTEVDFGALQKSSDRNHVLDSLNLVGLEAQCCLCVETYYYEFNEKTILRQVSTLTTDAFAPVQLDSRNGYAYKVSGGRGATAGFFQVRAEPISSDAIMTLSASTTITPKHVTAAFRNQNQ